MAGYLRFSLLNKLNDQLRSAYENSAQLACEQVAAMRTVASLNREVALHQEFVESLKAPVRRAMYSTLKSTAVIFHFLDRVDSSYLRWDKVLHFLRMP
jgi:ATP-binding cassette, subfamily B (MDR/TAP), member 1